MKNLFPQNAGLHLRSNFFNLKSNLPPKHCLKYYSANLSEMLVLVALVAVHCYEDAINFYVLNQLNMESSRLEKGTPKAKETHDGPLSLLRTLRIIETISRRPNVSTLANLSEDLKAPKSSLLGLLRALTQHGYLIHEANQYLLGPATHRLALAIMPNLTIPSIARPIMRQLAADTGETVVLAALDVDFRRVVYVDKIESDSPIRYTVPIGATRSLYSSAGGRVLLAHQSTQWIKDYLNSTPFEKQTEHTETDPMKLNEILSKVRKDGCSVTLAESSGDVAGFSAPVMDMDNQIAFALVLGAPIDRGRKNVDHYRTAVKTAAISLSSNMGVAATNNSVDVLEATD